jgi:hypothetical protein
MSGDIHLHFYDLSILIPEKLNRSDAMGYKREFISQFEKKSVIVHVSEVGNCNTSDPPAQYLNYSNILLIAS